MLLRSFGAKQKEFRWQEEIYTCSSVYRLELDNEKHEISGMETMYS